jgi:hypothetical protein
MMANVRALPTSLPKKLLTKKSPFSSFRPKKGGVHTITTYFLDFNEIITVLYDQYKNNKLFPDLKLSKKTIFNITAKLKTDNYESTNGKTLWSPDLSQFHADREIQWIYHSLSGLHPVLKYHALSGRKYSTLTNYRTFIFNILREVEMPFSNCTLRI